MQQLRKQPHASTLNVFSGKTIGGATPEPGRDGHAGYGMEVCPLRVSLN